jgi:hypothetical protein
MIGSLLYLCSSRPDIMLSVCMCARFQAAHKECHLSVVKRIMRYLVLTSYLVLWYPKGAHFELIGYSDGDYAGCKVDRKSTSGIGRAHPGLANFLVGLLCVGLLRNKIPLFYLRSKRSMLQTVVITHNYFRCDKL